MVSDTFAVFAAGLTRLPLYRFFSLTYTDARFCASRAIRRPYLARHPPPRAPGQMPGACHPWTLCRCLHGNSLLMCELQTLPGTGADLEKNGEGAISGCPPRGNGEGAGSGCPPRGYCARINAMRLSAILLLLGSLAVAQFPGGRPPSKGPWSNEKTSAGGTRAAAGAGNDAR